MISLRPAGRPLGHMFILLLLLLLTLHSSLVSSRSTQNQSSKSQPLNSINSTPVVRLSDTSHSSSLSKPTGTAHTDPIEWSPGHSTLDEKNAPCFANTTKNEIICLGPGQGDAELRHWFAAFAKGVNGPDAGAGDTLPYSLSINLRDLVALEANVFSGVTFTTILLRGHNLTYINADAFRGTEATLQSLYIYKTKLTSLPGKYDLFAAIRSLVNLKKLTITSNLLTTIPERAFAINNSETSASGLSELKEILISNGTLTSIGADAFDNLPKLTNLQLTKNRIKSIKPFAFRTTYRTNASLIIDLTENHLEASSFELNSLAGAQRPLKINFGLGGCNAQLKTLPEVVFKQFLNENERNIVDVGRECFNLACDCSMAWTLEERYMYRVKNFRCLVGNHRSSMHYRDYAVSLNCTIGGVTDSKATPSNEPPIAKQKHNEIYSPTRNGTRVDQGEEAPPFTNASSHHILTISPPPPLSPSSSTPKTPTRSGTEPPPGEYCQHKNCLKHGTEMNSYLNRSVDPCESFYDYACNGWENNHLLEYLLQVLSNGGSEYDNFVKVRLKIEENLDKLLTVDTDKLAVPAAVAAVGSSIRHFDESSSTKDRISQLNILPFTNTKAMYGQCLTPPKGVNFEALQLILKDIGGWPLLTKTFDGSAYSWEETFVTILTKYKDNIFIEVDSGINEQSRKHLVIKAGSFIVSKRKLLSVKLNRLENYANYMLNTALHFGALNNQNETLNEIWEVIRFEKMIANIAKKNMDNMIERKLETIGCLIKEINWFRILYQAQAAHRLMNESQFSNAEALYDVHYLIDLSRLLERTEKRIIANYLGWRVVEAFGFLIGGSAFVEIQQNFYSTESREGTKLIKKQCLEPVLRSLPYLMTRVYLDRHLPLHSRKNARNIVEAVRESFVKSISNKMWIDDSREALIKRVNNISVNIGYPDWILDDRNLISHYGKLNYTRLNESATEELVRFYSTLQEVYMQHVLTDLGGQINKSYYWDPLPLYVGASYDIVDNIVSIPMGLLQTPFYEEDRPFYLNFASLGSFFGHELAHSVTPRYTEFERLMAPWSDHFLKEYLSKAQCFVSQYTNYYDKTAEQHLDGMRTFEEDMSDLAGIQAAFNAYKEMANRTSTAEAAAAAAAGGIGTVHLQRLSELPDFSTDMLFFLSFAQKWCRSNSRVQTRLKISKSVHSPEKYRVNGALSNLDAFARAFNCTAGTPMNPVKRCDSW